MASEEEDELLGFAFVETESHITDADKDFLKVEDKAGSIREGEERVDRGLEQLTSLMAFSVRRKKAGCSWR